jgi:hypothetical protein
MSTVHYYRLPDGEPTTQLKRMLPQISNPQHLTDPELATHGIARVLIERPALQWWQQYGGRVLDQAQTPHLSTWAAEDLPLATAKDLAWQRVKAERDQRQSGLMPYNFPGYGVLHSQMTEKVRADLSASTTGAIVLQGQGVESPLMAWTTHENITVMLTPAAFIAFGVAALQWHSAIHLRSQVIRTAIDAAEDVAGVVAAAEWGEE